MTLCVCVHECAHCMTRCHVSFIVCSGMIVPCYIVLWSSLLNFINYFLLFLHDSFILGFAANTPNLYVYVSNNPLVVKDPNGEFAPFLIIPVVGALKGLGGYVLTTPPSQYTVGG